MIDRCVLEWQKLPYGEGDGQIPLPAAERLAAVAARSPLGGPDGSNILTLTHKALVAGQVVGVIVADGCRLEVLPKLDQAPAGPEADERPALRLQLVHMLATILDFDIAAGENAGLAWQRESLLEILIGLFLDALVDAVRQGLPRQYLQHEDDLPRLRGRLDVQRQFTVLAASPQRLASRYDELSPDIVLNQIMKAALGRLRQLSRSARNQRQITELSFVYADIASVPVKDLRWDRVILDRTNRRWRKLLQLAQLLLGGRFQGTSTGATLGFSLLFEMNTLFEQYVATIMMRTAGPTGFHVKPQDASLYCLEAVGDDGRLVRRFQTQPDIVLRRHGETRLLIDTKWKRLASTIDDPKNGVAQADVYQMMAYARVHRSRNLLLLYPHHGGLGRPEGLISDHRITGSSDRLIVGTIDLLNRKAIAEKLWSLVHATSRLEHERVEETGRHTSLSLHAQSAGTVIESITD